MVLQNPEEISHEKLHDENTSYETHTSLIKVRVDKWFNLLIVLYP